MFRTKFGNVYTWHELEKKAPRELARADLFDLGTGLLMFGVKRSEVADAVLKGVEFDWAVPQDWYDAHVKHYPGGKTDYPDAIWVYDKGYSIMGRPMYFYELLGEFKRLVRKEVMTAKEEPID